MQLKSLLFQNDDTKVSADRQKPGPSVPTASLRNLLAEWIDDGEWRGHSVKTRALHTQIGGYLLWFLAENSLASCGTGELRRMLMYLQNAHTGEGGLWHGDPAPPGRWGNPQAIRPVRKSTVHTYHTRLKTFFRWLVTQGYLDASPMDRLAAPVYRRDQIRPFTDDQITTLAAVAASRPTRCARRDAVILWLLYDTGLRASEICGLRRRDLDMTEKRLTVVRGKGDKARVVYFGRYATKALWDYLRAANLDEDGPLFPSESATRRGQPLAARSVRDMMQRVNRVAGVTGVRVTTHTVRHSFAISFLRGGGTLEALKELLGHTSLAMTLNYVRLAEADLEGQRQYSPADRLTGRSSAASKAAQIKSSVTAAAGKRAAEKQAAAEERQAARQREAEEKTCGVHTEKIHGARVTEEEVREIKRALALPKAERPSRAALAAQYGLSLSSIKQIALGLVWKHVLI